MSSVTIQIPENYIKKLEELSQQGGMSVEEFIRYAAIEKIGAIQGVQYLQEQAQKGSRDVFEKVLSMVPDRQPDTDDTIPQ